MFLSIERIQGMLIGIKDSNIGLEAKIIEPVINREASNYIINNWSNLLLKINGKIMNSEKSNDLLSDVYISVIDAENNGNSFDMEYGSRVEEDGTINFSIMSVEQYVIGRINLYAKNLKYSTDVIEATTGNVYETHVLEMPVIDKNGQEIIENGKVKTTRKVERVKVETVITTSAASFDDGKEFSENDELQQAYSLASTADFSEKVAEKDSLRENISYCIDVCDKYDFKLMNILKNIELLANLIGEISKKKKSANSVFGRLLEIAEENDEFMHTFINVIRFSASNKAEFEAALEKIETTNNLS